MDNDAEAKKAERVRELNDHARRTFTGATIVVTATFAALTSEIKAIALSRVRAFEDFEPSNDPHGEHDMAFFDDAGHRFFFKLDYYDPSMQFASDDPADPISTRRVLTIGLDIDY